MNKAVIASPVDGTKELIEDGKTGLFVKHGQAKELADAVLLLNKNKKLSQLLGNNASKFVRAKLGIKKLVEQVQILYKEMVT